MELQMTEKQRAFVEAGADEVLFGGAAGGGKSYGQLIDALLYALRYPGSRQLILRRTYPDLERSLIRVSLGLFPREVYRYNRSAHTGQFKNGSVIDFGYCDSEADVYRYQGAEYDTIRFDELTHFTESMYLYLISRLRGANPYPKQVKSSTNPGGVGHQWVKARFIDIGPPGVEHRAENGTRIFLPSLVDDNIFLMEKDPDYKRRLENLEERDRRALLYGDWDLTEGRYFQEWDRSLHVLRPFAIPEDWRRYFVMDYGLDMLAGYWIALDPRGWAYVYRELYEGKDNGLGAGGGGHIVSEAARRIRELTPPGEKLYSRIAPPDLWNRQKDTGQSIAELFAREGLPLTRASNDRVMGWLALREWLRPTVDESGEPAAGLRIFENCLNLIRCLPALQCDPKDPQDVAAEPHELTHGPDALRYFVAGRPRPGRLAAPPPRYNFDFERPRPSPGGYGEKVKVI